MGILPEGKNVMRKTVTADLAVVSAMASIGAEDKAADRREAVERANRFATDMMDRVRRNAATVRAAEAQAAAARGAAFAATPRGRRLLAARG